MREKLTLKWGFKKHNHFVTIFPVPPNCILVQFIAETLMKKQTLVTFPATQSHGT
uniref:Uncharacterized protein n=1 Tax=Anguilla anguilla TaxID=7936 RepID=A0A0E9RJD9_ANGAN